MAGKGQSIIMSQVVPRPNAVAHSIVKRYSGRPGGASATARAKFGFTSLEGYIAGRGCDAKPQSSRERRRHQRVARFKDALSDLNVDLGGYRVRIRAAKPAPAPRFVDVVAIDRTGRIIG